MSSIAQAAVNQAAKLIGGALAFGFGVSDVWRFHALAQSTDLVFIVGGLGVLGVSVAYNAGLNADPVPPK